VLTTQKETSTGTGLLLSPAVRVDVVDPSAYTPPYDHALCAALARAGARVRLMTSAFVHGSVPRAEGYAVDERFYRGVPAGGRARVAAKLARHGPDMIAAARAARRDADVVHFQWLAVQPLDAVLLRAFPRPLVLTAHDVLPREPRPGQRAAQRRLYERVDAVVVHSEHGRARLVDELGLPPGKVTVIPHGVLRPAGDDALPAELAGVQGPVALFFGLLRPYKGLDVLLDAWRGIEGAELWVVGMPRMDTSALRAAAPPGVRFVERFVPDRQVAAFFRRADLAVLPYREIDQSGVLFTALGAGTPLVLSAVGGFPEIAADGAAELVAPGDPGALHATLARLLGDPETRERLASGARRAAEERYGWDAIARRHLDLYAKVAA
jgi:glycosyltransferase involved in cell wall biosynthesis